jgi:hypothetical protein
MKSEFDKRRTRLGAPKPEQLRKDIGLEVWRSSKVNPSCKCPGGKVDLCIAASGVVQ